MGIRFVPRAPRFAAARTLAVLFSVALSLVLGQAASGSRSSVAFAQGAKAAKKASKAAPAEGGGDIMSLLKQAMYSYDEGDLDAAREAFEKAFSMNPTSDVIAKFVDTVGASKLYQLLQSKDQHIAGAARQILQSSTQVLRTMEGGIDNQKSAAAAVGETLGADGQDYLIKRRLNTSKYGRNLVPMLVPMLADSDISRRTKVINWIGTEIGLSAVPILQAARKHPDATVRRNVADLLGARALRHAVSLGTLKAMVEVDQDAEVKAAAQASMKAILSDLDGHAKTLGAKEYFLENALFYYKTPHRNPFAVTYYTPTVYRLEGEAIVGEVVAEFQLSMRMADQALDEALDLDPSYFEAQVLRLSNDAAQVYDYDLNVAFYAKNESSTNVKELLEKQKPYVDAVLRNRLLMWPEKVVNEALLLALEDGKSEVGREILGVIRGAERNGTVPEPLVKALEDTNSRLVRIGAATALAFWNPVSKDFDAGDLVVSILSEAVVTSGVRTVQKVMGDIQHANYFDKVLSDLNMESYTPHPNLEEAMAAVTASPPDLVIMDESVIKTTGRKEIAPVNYFVGEMRKNYRTAGIPVLVVVPAEAVAKAKGLYESEERKVWVVPDTADKLSLSKTVLDKVFADKDDSKAHATRLARSSAEAINFLASVPTRIPVRKCVPSLLQVLKNRPDEVRLPCIRALGNLRATEAAGELAIVYSNGDNAKEIRVEAMRSVAKALQRSKGPATPAVLKIIEDGMMGSDLELRQVAWMAFANAGPDAKRQLAAARAQPPEGGAAPAGPEKAAPAEKEAAKAEPAEEKKDADAAGDAAGDKPAEGAPEKEEPAKEEPSQDDAGK